MGDKVQKRLGSGDCMILLGVPDGRAFGDCGDCDSCSFTVCVTSLNSCLRVYSHRAVLYVCAFRCSDTFCVVHRGVAEDSAMTWPTRQLLWLS